MKKRLTLTTKTLLLALCMLVMSNYLHAQVTIGSGNVPNRAAILDLKSQQADAANTTSDKGGLLLPRVALKSTNTLEPFVPATDGEWTDPAKKAALMKSVVGLMVYNVATVGTSLYPGLYTWDGQKWATSQANPSAGIEIGSQPRAFSFYERGNEPVDALTFTLSGLEPADVITYQWYQVTGNNIHVSVGTALTSATYVSKGSKTASFTPSHVIKGPTNLASNTGFYRFYCIATNSYGKEYRSDIAEVAVGCGAKNNLGEWVSFMCFNLGADNNSTIASQRNFDIPYSYDSSTGLHAYQAGEENLYGSLFQWGRIPDGHELRLADNSNIRAYSGITTADIASGLRCTSAGGSPSGDRFPSSQVKEGTNWYGKFIYGPPAPAYNWNPIDVQSTLDNLWRTTRFAPNDPCAQYKADGSYKALWHTAANGGTDGQTNPSSDVCDNTGTNWRTPTQAEWGQIYRDGTLAGSPALASANTWTWYVLNAGGNRGYEIKPDGQTTTLLLPANGNRRLSNGAFYYQGVGSDYWSSSVIGVSSYNLTFGSSSVNPAGSNARGYGMALRCIKNQ